VSEIPVRTLRFEIPASLDPVIIRDEPEESYLNVAMSLLLPHLEPYLIRTMCKARPQITTPALAADLDAFCGQEGQHYRQHAALNQAFRAWGLSGADALEAAVAADYKRFSAERPLRFNLAYAEGFEALTTAMALVFVGEDTSRWDPIALDLFQWHLTEELEHRTVAFEVYEHVVGSYAYRAAVGAFAQWHLLRFLKRAADAMLAADPRTERAYGGAAGRRAREPRMRALFAQKVWPRLRQTYRPSYSPRAIALPATVAEFSRRYSARLAT
jgi:predicted metal-dependent hydrolase